MKLSTYYKIRLARAQFCSGAIPLQDFSEDVLTDEIIFYKKMFSKYLVIREIL